MKPAQIIKDLKMMGERVVLILVLTKKNFCLKDYAKNVQTMR